MPNIFLFCILLSHIAISTLSLKIVFIGPSTTNSPTLAQANWEHENGDPGNASLQVVDIGADGGPMVLQSFLLPASMKSGSFEVELRSAGTFQLQGVSLQNSQAHVFVSSNTITIPQSGLPAVESTIPSISQSQPSSTHTSIGATIISNATPVVTPQSQTGADPKVIIVAVLGTALGLVGFIIAIFLVRRCHRLWVPGIYDQRKRPLFQWIIPRAFHQHGKRMSQSLSLPIVNPDSGKEIVQQERNINHRHADPAVQIPHSIQGNRATSNSIKSLGYIQPNHARALETIREDDSEATYIGSSVSRYASTDLMEKAAEKQGPKVVNRSSVVLSVLEEREHSWVLATKLAPVYVNRDLPPIPEQSSDAPVLEPVKKGKGKGKDGIA